MNSAKKPDAVAVGCWVRINDPDIGEETIYLVPPKEESPERGRFSTSSPFAEALIGTKPGEKVSYTVPNGTTEHVEVREFGWDT